MTVYLVPGARGRHELYSETAVADPAKPADAQPQGRVGRWMQAARREWQTLVEQAQHGNAEGAFGRWRDRIVCSLAESIAEQRTLWALRGLTAADLFVPVSLDGDRGRHVLMLELGHARRHHLQWLVIDGLIFIASGALAIVPGPNVLAYYFLFRVVGHLQSWRGARQAMDRVAWSIHADASLDELAALVDAPREARAPRVEAIAERLQLTHLAAFFDRIALPST